MIVVKIWRVRRQSTLSYVHPRTSKHEGRTLANAMRIIVESAAMYTISMFLFFATLLANNNFQYPASDVVCVRPTRVLIHDSTHLLRAPHSGSSRHCWRLYCFSHFSLHFLTITLLFIPGYIFQPDHHTHKDWKLHRTHMHNSCRTRRRTGVTLP